MTLRWGRLLLVSLVGFLAVVGLGSGGHAAAASFDSSTIYYNLEYAGAINPTTVFITISVSEGFGATLPLVVSMPRGVPSDYSEELYDSFVQNLTAVDSQNQPLSITKDPNGGPRWVLNSTSSAGGSFGTLTYSIDLAAQEQGILSGTDASKVRPGRYLGIFGVSVFAYLFDYEDSPIQVTFTAFGPGGTPWNVFSTLQPNAVQPNGTDPVFVATANDYYLLQDSQFGAGPELDLIQIPVGGYSAEFYLMVYSEGAVDLSMMSGLAQTAALATFKWFSANGTKPLPFSYYTLWVELVEPIDAAHQYGFGLEHLQSAHFCLPTDETILSNSSLHEQVQLTYLFVHHISHAWIPKRCYCEYYYPFQFELAPSMDLIWFNEGWAQYIGIQAFASYINSSELFETMVYERFTTSLQAVPDYMLDMPLNRLSQIGSTQYSLDFRTGMTLFSRGGLMAYNVDMLIQSESNNQFSLRDPILTLISLVEDTQQPVTVEILVETIEKVTSVNVRKTMVQWLRGSPQSLSPAFSNHIIQF